MFKPTKLLSVLAAATAVAACAGARAPSPRAPVATAVEFRAAREAPVNELMTPSANPSAAPEAAPAVVAWTPAMFEAVVDQPLLQANGRPACGNVQSKSSNSMRNCKD